MRRHVILVTLVALVAASLGPGAARALTFLELATGDEGLVPDARSIAMGRTRVGEATGAFTAGTNPALLGTLEQPLVMVGGHVLKMKESRKIPAYDSFDGFLVESIYVLNDEYHVQGGLGAAAAFQPEGFPGRIGAGISFAPVRDFQYTYTEEVRDNDAFTRPRDFLLGLHEVEGTGTIDALAAGVGVTLWEKVSAGLSLEYVTGGYDVEIRTFYAQEERTEASGLNASSLSGYRSVVGLCLQPSHRVGFGFTWKNEVTLDGNYVRRGESQDLGFLGESTNAGFDGGPLEVTYPHELVVGASFRPRALLPSTVHVEAGWTQWSSFAHELYDGLVLDDVWDVRFGIEHVFYNHLPIRFGFLYRPSPRDDEITTTAFTFGGGFMLGPLQADLAFEVTSREYHADDLFPESLFGGDDRTQPDKVEESGAAAFVTLSYALDSLAR